MIARTQFAGDPAMVGEARRFVSRTLVKVGVPRELVDDAELVVSELATNAVEHTVSGKAGSRFEVTVKVTAARVCVEVLDQGSAQSPTLCKDVDQDHESEHGRGLFIVAALGEVHAHRTSDGLVVGVVLDRPDAAAVLAALAGKPGDKEVS